MIPTGIKITDMTTKWGLVTVSNRDGSINRQLIISGRAADEVTKNNNLVPAGVTYEEWHSGAAMLSGRPCDIGNAVVGSGGDLVVNYGVEKIAGAVTVKLMHIPASEWSLVGGVVNIVEDVAAQVDVPFQPVYKS